MKLHLCCKPTRGKEKTTNKNEKEKGNKIYSKTCIFYGAESYINKYSSNLLVPRYF